MSSTVREVGAGRQTEICLDLGNQVRRDKTRTDWDGRAQAMSRGVFRRDEALPDYIYAVNILRQHGIYPTLDYLEGENRLRTCVDFDDCLRKVTWSLGELTPDECERLRLHYERHPGRLGEMPMPWALVSWEKGRPGSRPSGSSSVEPSP